MVSNLQIVDKRSGVQCKTYTVLMLKRRQSTAIASIYSVIDFPKSPNRDVGF